MNLDKIIIGKYYEKIGWKPSRGTKKILDKASDALKKSRSKRGTRQL